MTSARCSWKKKLAIGVGIALAVFAAVAALLAWKYLSPSVNIDRYARYYLHAGDAPPRSGAIKVTFLGTATLLFDDGETQLMTDGFLSRPSARKILTRTPIQTDTAVVDAILSRAKVERLKALFVAHSHYDHSFDVAYVAQRTGAHLYGSVSTLNVGRGGGLREDQLSLYQPGRGLEFGKFTVTILNSKHSPPTAVNNDLGQVIEQPLRQPAQAEDYKEGGAFDMLIRHGEHAILVKASGNFIEGAWDGLRADVVFLGAGGLGRQTPTFRDAYYDQTIAKVHPRLVIPIHWDNFLLPLSDQLVPLYRLADDLQTGLDFLIRRLTADQIQFGILQGFQSVMLFEHTKDS